MYVKTTIFADCINFHSICTDRAYHVSLDPANFYNKVQRLSQLFTNNNFPVKLIKTTVEQFLNKKLEPQQPVIQDLNTITFFFQNQMSSSYKGEERKLKEMIQKHVPPNENYSVKLLSKLFHQTSY